LCFKTVLVLVLPLPALATYCRATLRQPTSYRRAACFPVLLRLTCVRLTIDNLSIRPLHPVSHLGRVAAVHHPPS
jgi:hypothetical protein